MFAGTHVCNLRIAATLCVSEIVSTAVVGSEGDCVNSLGYVEIGRWNQWGLPKISSKKCFPGIWAPSLFMRGELVENYEVVYSILSQVVCANKDFDRSQI